MMKSILIALALFAVAISATASADEPAFVEVADADSFSDELEVQASDAMTEEDEAAEEADTENVESLT